MAQVFEAYAPRFIQRLHSKYLHNQHILNSNWALNLEKSNPIFAKINNSMSFDLLWYFIRSISSFLFNLFLFFLNLSLIHLFFTFLHYV